MPISGSLEGKVAVITGGASGIGRAGAHLFEAERAEVVITDFNQEGGLRVSRAIVAAGNKGSFVQVDVRDTRSVWFCCINDHAARTLLQIASSVRPKPCGTRY